MKKAFYAVAIALTVLSCNRADEQHVITNEATPITKVVGRTSNNNSTEARRAPREGIVNILIFEFSIGRESKGCKGWGICDFEWFPDFNNGRVTSGDNYSRAEVWKYADGTYDLEFYLTNPDGANDPIVVESDLVSGITSEGTRLYIKAGSYSFDAGLGENGGYNIPVYVYN